ncbi:MAG: carbon starvation CstA family protein [Thermoguttaceae bacterium]
MSTLIVTIISFICFILAYQIYGRFIAQKLFQLQDDEPVPSVQQRDNIDFIPTNRFVLFGHHFTTIAGTGPIVGPAIAVFWGWLPALLWIVFGSIFIGAVHDMVALILSMRNRGKTLGEITGNILSPSARLLFLILLTFILALVIAVFCSIIATMFHLFPASVVPVWTSLPLAMLLGVLVYRFNLKLLFPSIAALLILYGVIWMATYSFPAWEISGVVGVPLLNPTMIWVFILLVYCFVASTLPVWILLQPRDYLNSQQLFIALIPVILGMFYAAFFGMADIASAAPAIRDSASLTESGAPPIWPFLFITVACGAASGFHALVSSGTTSKQIASAKDVRLIGYGGMLSEGALAIIVLIACTAGIGMGTLGGKSFDPTSSAAQQYLKVISSHKADGHIDPFTLYNDGMSSGHAGWQLWYGDKWRSMNLGRQVGVFVEGSSNFLEGIGIPPDFAHTLMAVLIVCFAATTVDSATRLLRYVIQELGHAAGTNLLDNRFTATGVAVALAGLLASCRGIKPDGTFDDYGTGGMILWPLFGSCNQVIVGLTLLIGVVYLFRRHAKVRYLLIPAMFMLLVPIWGMIASMTGNAGWFAKGQYHLVAMGIAVFALIAWLLIESIRAVQTTSISETKTTSIPEAKNMAIQNESSILRHD